MYRIATLQPAVPIVGEPDEVPGKTGGPVDVAAPVGPDADGDGEVLTELAPALQHGQAAELGRVLGDQDDHGVRRFHSDADAPGPVLPVDRVRGVHTEEGLGIGDEAAQAGADRQVQADVGPREQHVPLHVEGQRTECRAIGGGAGEDSCARPEIEVAPLPDRALDGLAVAGEGLGGGGEQNESEQHEILRSHRFH